MVAAGEATVEQIDLSITDGPGLRWPIHGPMLTFHLAGGQGGMAHMLDHFGPSLLSPWTRLVAAELTPELRDAVVDGCEREADGRTIDDLVAERDRGRDRGPARAGPRMSRAASSGGSRSRTRGSTTTATSPSPTTCWCFGHATDAVMDAVGLGPAYRDAHDASLYTVEAHVRYLDEVSAGSDLEVRSSVIGATGKLLWIWHELWVDGRLRATEEVLGVHVRRRVVGAVPRRRRGPRARGLRRAARARRSADRSARSS